MKKTIGIVLIFFTALIVWGDSFSVQTKIIDISPNIVNDEKSVLGYAKLAPLTDGSLMVGYQSDKNAHIVPLDKNYNRLGKDIILRNYELHNMHPLPDGTFLLVLGKDIQNTYIENYSNTLFIMKMDKKGNTIFNTRIFGGNGHGPGKSWYDGRAEGEVTFNGSEYGIYFEVQKNWAEPGEGEDIHNGDMFVVLDKKGEIKPEREHFWTASHSSTPRTAAGSDGNFYTFTIGDAYPWGLQLYNRNSSFNTVVWPPESEWKSYEESNSANAPGILEFMYSHNNSLIAALATEENPNLGWDSKTDVLFLKTDYKGQILKEIWLTKTPNKDESKILVTPYQGNLLFIWGPGNVYENDWQPDPPTLAVVDFNGNFIEYPEKLSSFPLGSSSDAGTMANGDALWTYADNYSSSITLYVVESAGTGDINRPSPPRPSRN